MEYTHRIYAIAPTSYQLNALQRFHLDVVVAKFGGSIKKESLFFSEEDAKNYLHDIASEYFENEDQLNETQVDIEHGALTIDGVTAYIEEIEIL